MQGLVPLGPAEVGPGAHVGFLVGGTGAYPPVGGVGLVLAGKVISTPVFRGGCELCRHSSSGSLSDDGQHPPGSLACVIPTMEPAGCWVRQVSIPKW